MNVWTTPLRYERLTWPEVRRAAGENRVALIPVGTLEDHGPHLPLDADLRIISEICSRAAQAASDDVVLLPHNVSPGGTVEVPLSLTAPPISGDLELEFRVTQALDGAHGSVGREALRLPIRVQ